MLRLLRIDSGYVQRLSRVPEWGHAMPLENSTIAFIGSGVMGEAMIKGILGKMLVPADRIYATDIHRDRIGDLAKRFGVHVTTDNIEAAKRADILVFCVKPQAMERVMAQLSGHVEHCGLVLSIVAGVGVGAISTGLANPNVVRAMPNTPGQIGQGITVWTAALAVDDLQRKQAQAILWAMGDEMYVEEEYMLDMATALSGTGPAYVFMFMEALIDAGVHLGFSRRDSERLVLQTVRGSVEYAIASKIHPAQLRNQVTSPGGTSASALYEMEKGRFRTVVADAVWAAFRRSVELGKGDGR
jgi:pyrroline-5-carboxylate reductase